MNGLTPLCSSEMVSFNRNMLARKIVNPVGNADLYPAEEKKLRRSILEETLTALQVDMKEQVVLR